MSWRRRAVAALLALGSVLMGAAAATAQSGTTAAPSTSARGSGITATSITVGGIADASLYGGVAVGARARFQRANDAGGVDGRTIDFRGVTDDAGDPGRDTTVARRLLAQGVAAVVPVVTPALAGSTVLVARRVPYFGWALSSDFCGNAYGFGFTGCPVPAGRTSNAWPSLVAKALPPGIAHPTVAVLADDSPSGQYALRSLTAAAESVRLQVVYGKAQLGVAADPDYDAIAKAVLTSNDGTVPAAVFVVGGASDVLGMQQALTADGFLGFFTNQIQYSPGYVAPALHALVSTQTAPVETAGNGAVQQLVQDVQAVAPGQPIDQSVTAGYWSADLFLRTVQRAGRHLTRASLVRAANADFTYGVPGTVGPTRFPAAHSVPTPCGALVTSDGTAFSVKVPYTCGRVVRVR